MTAQAGQSEERQVVPRWRPFADTVRLGELRTLEQRTAADDDEVKRAQQKAVANSSRYGRAELLSTLMARADFAGARGLAESMDDDMPPLLRGVLERLAPSLDGAVGGPNGGDFDPSAVAVLLGAGARRRLKVRPNNPVAWVDLALAHTIQGFTERAAREIDIALQLAPDNRFVLRSAARLYVHTDRPDQANRIIRSSRRLDHDPWLMAAELSTAQLAFGHARNALKGRAIIEESGFSPYALSELVSELATAELQSGSDRRARALFQQSFVDPTENAVAQAVSWADRSNVELAPDLLAKDGVFEARTLENARNGLWASATSEAASWHRDQPFSVEPFRFASYTASVGSALYSEAARIAVAGLRLHKNDRALRNNAAYALANLDMTDEARMFASTHARPETADDFVEFATMGLIEFREGEPIQGAQKYQRAVGGLNRLGRADMAAMAAAQWALEEFRMNLPTASQVLLRAVRLLPDLPQAERDAFQARLFRPVSENTS